ncbi:MAG TPA: VOC family protein, partial [Luteimonas sp.]|nr:VOC family protein [Luteimonas sp.]
MRYLHTMLRVRDLDASLRFYSDGLGLREVRRTENAQGKFTLVFLSAPDSPEAEIELTYNW